MGRRAAEPPDLTTIGGRLRWAREKAGYPSSRAAAKEFGWNENTYKAHEQGDRGKEGLKTAYIERYTRAFKINADWLMMGKGQAKKTVEPDEDEVMVEAFRQFVAQQKAKQKVTS